MTDTALARRRRTPSQARSRETVDAICAAAGAIIEEHGLAALSTNAVAARAGVSITSIYAYFPDKWAIVHELFERFERMRGDAVEELVAELHADGDWRDVMSRIWDRMVRFRVEVPAGMALRRAFPSSPSLTELDRRGSERSARLLADVMLVRRPDLGPDRAWRASWAATLVAATILDDVVRDGVVDDEALAEGKTLIRTYLALYLDPPA